MTAVAKETTQTTSRARLRARLALVIFAILALAIVVSAGRFFGLGGEIAFYARYWQSADAPTKGILPGKALAKCKGCNLLLVSLDTLRADHLGFLGSTATKTPNLDKIAARSQVFGHVYTNAYYTTPSHMTVFTSLLPASHKVDSRHVRLSSFRNLEMDETEFSEDEKLNVLDPNVKTIAETLKARGYSTLWRGPLRSKYLDFKSGFGRGFDANGPSPFFRGREIGTYKRSGFDTHSLTSLSGKRSAMVFLHSYLTHSPYFFREEDLSGRAPVILYDKDLLSRFATHISRHGAILVEQRDERPKTDDEAKAIVEACRNLTDLRTCLTKFMSVDTFWHAVGQMQNISAMYFFNDHSDPDETKPELQVFRGAYANGVEKLDAQVGDLWAWLEKSGALENTVVVFFSDHGEELLEHGKTSHVDFFEHTTRVPMMIFDPKMPASRYEGMGSLVDLMPTILGVLDIAVPPSAEGHALPENANPFILGQTLGWDFMVSDDGWKLIRDRFGDERFFHLPSDPGEHHDLLDLRNGTVQSAYARVKAAREKMILEQSL